MIARFWRGWTTRENSGPYEELLRAKILPGIHRVNGYSGAYLLRRDFEKEVEFVTLTFFDSLEAIHTFAGPDYETAVVPPEARKLLSRFDRKSLHYDVVTRIE